MSTYNVIGIMSGTSLDGLDICFCSFSRSDHPTKWDYVINDCETINLPQDLKSKLSAAVVASGLDLSILNINLGEFIGKSINDFIRKNSIDRDGIDFISSHGHTIFHQPDKNLTLQIGSGAAISGTTKLKVICDFRSLDLVLNGNGAPLVPIGDKLLFGQFESCVNLGGIANISYDNENIERIAYDICPANMLLNTICNKIDLAYDSEGNIAKSGQLNKELYEKLNSLSYYKKRAPKSLGYEWFQENLMSLIDKSSIPIEDILNTCTEHIAYQIGKELPSRGKALFTGGGSHNKYLIERVKNYSNSEIVIPENEIIDFKEALIFGFLGTLRYINEVNTLNSVTGASTNSIGGCIYNPFTSS
jgi:anhydro-N-acetylmuramic acid kinase